MRVQAQKGQVMASMKEIKDQDSIGTEHQRALEVMKVIRILVLVLAVTGLVILLIRFGIDPASAGKKSGH